MTRTPVPRDESHVAAIPTWIYESGQLASLGGAAALMLLALYSSIAPGRSKEIGQRLLARKTGLHRVTVGRAVQQLVTLGLVTVEHRGRGRTRFTRPARPARTVTPTTSAKEQTREDRRPVRTVQPDRRAPRPGAIVCDIEWIRAQRRAAGLE